MAEDQEVVDEEETVEGLRESLEALRLLVKSQGWGRLKRWLDAQIHTRTDAIILSPVETLDKTLSQEYMKGEVQGLRLVRDMPGIMIEQFDADLKMRRRDENV